MLKPAYDAAFFTVASDRAETYFLFCSRGKPCVICVVYTLIKTLFLWEQFECMAYIRSSVLREVIQYL